MAAINFEEEERLRNLLLRPEDELGDQPLDLPTAQPEAKPVPPVAIAAPSATPDANVGGAMPAISTPKVPTKLEQDQNEVARLQKSGSGIDQIMHPVDALGNPDTSKHPGKLKRLGSIAARIGDIAGSALFPTVMMNIPGTTYHHQMLENQAEGNVQEDLENQQTAAKAAHDQALANAPVDPGTPEQQYIKDIIARNPGMTVADAVKQYTTDTAKAGSKPSPEDEAFQYLVTKQGMSPIEAYKAVFAAKTEGKPENRDDKAIGIYMDEAKKANPNLTDDQAYKIAYEKFVDINKVQPRVQGYAALNTGRFIPVIDPERPDTLIPMRTGDAASGKASLPGSIPFATRGAVEKKFLAGDVSNNLIAINTAREHINSVLLPLAQALKNGDVQILNKIGNQLGVQFGQDQATNYRIAAAAVGSESAKAFDGAGMTAGERDEAKERITDMLSSGQILGAVMTTDALLEGKQKVLKVTYDVTRGGTPNFGANHGGSQNSGARTISLAKARQLPRNKGKSDSEIKKDIEAHGHKVVD